MKTVEEMNAANRWQAYMKGWKAGAGVKAMDPMIEQHPDNDLRKAYSLGYADGRIAHNNAGTRATELFGYTPSVLRLAESEPVAGESSKG